MTGQLTGYDPDGDNITYRLATAPRHTKISEDGTVAFSLTLDGTFHYTPSPDFTGLDVFTYSMTDGVASSRVFQVAVVVYADIYIFAEEDTLIITEADLTDGVANPTGGSWTIELESQPRWGQITVSGSGDFVYQFDTNLYSQTCEKLVLSGEQPLFLDTFTIVLRDEQLAMPREVGVILNPFVWLDQISPPTQGDGSGQLFYSPTDPSNNIIDRLRNFTNEITGGTWFVMAVDEVVPGGKLWATWQRGPWFGHGIVGIVDVHTREVAAYGFHINGLGRWFSRGFQGSILDNTHYNYDVARA